MTREPMFPFVGSIFSSVTGDLRCGHGQKFCFTISSYVIGRRVGVYGLQLKTELKHKTEVKHSEKLKLLNFTATIRVSTISMVFPSLMKYSPFAGVGRLQASISTMFAQLEPDLTGKRVLLYQTFLVYHSPAKLRTPVIKCTSDMAYVSTWFC